MDFRKLKYNLNKSFSDPDVSTISREKLDKTHREIYDKSLLDTSVSHPANEYPIIRRLYVEEIYQRHPTSTMYKRQYSWEQIRSPSFIQGSYQRQNYRLNDEPRNTDEGTYFHRKRSTFGQEPMDVDIDTISVSDSSEEIDQSDNEEVNSENLKTKYNLIDETDEHRSIVKHKPLESEVKSSLHPLKVVTKKGLPLSVKCMFISIIIISVAALVNYLVFDYNAQINIEQLEEELYSKVHGQRDPIHTVLNNLKLLNHEWHRNVKVISFIGRKGTGKTFIANMVKNNFYYKLVNDLHGSIVRNQSEQNKVITNLYRHYCNLIVIDDLTADDVEVLHNFVDRLEEEEVLVLVLAVFSIHKVNEDMKYVVNYSDIANIRTAFSKRAIFGDVVIFEEFDETHLREWLGNQLVSHGIHCKHHDKITENILASHDIDKHGFKGLRPKFIREINKAEYYF